MSSNLIQMIWDSFLETIIMVAISGGIGALAGIPLGILLFVTDRKSFLPMPGFNAVLGTVINALRSVPFIILLVAIIPFTRLIVGSSIGTAAALIAPRAGEAFKRAFPWFLAVLTLACLVCGLLAL